MAALNAPRVAALGAARRAARRAWWAVAGRPVEIAAAHVRAHPELAEARWRGGGLAVRVGGWCLGRARVDGITIGRTIFLADPGRASPALLLHELAHVRQFARVRGFAVRYCWESVRRGYRGNRYEADADAFAARCLAERAAAGRASHPS